MTALRTPLRRPLPTQWAAFVVGLVLVGLLPLLARALARPSPDRCAADGLSLAAGHGARVVLGPSRSSRFCGVACAERWLLTSREAPQGVLVVDEASGDEMAVDQAYFVRSLVRRSATGDRVHAFARREDAERHARAYAGTLLEDSSRPFATRPWCRAGLPTETP